MLFHGHANRVSFAESVFDVSVYTEPNLLESTRDVLSKLSQQASRTLRALMANLTAVAACPGTACLLMEWH